jgi:hypothetical protein
MRVEAVGIEAGQRRPYRDTHKGHLQMGALSPRSVGSLHGPVLNKHCCLWVADRQEKTQAWSKSLQGGVPP